MSYRASPRPSFGGRSALIFLILLANNGAYAAERNLTNGVDKEMEANFNQYSLPYGVLGAISHILTYYVLLCHYYGRRPLQPWRHLTRAPVNMCSVVISSIVSITIIAVTLTKVHESQPLVVLASLQVVLSVVMDLLNVHRFLRRKQEGLIRATILWGAILYAVSYASIYAMSQMISMSTPRQLGNSRSLNTLTNSSIESNRLQNRWDAISITLVVLACGSGAIAFFAFIAWIRAGFRADGKTLHVLAVAGLVCSCAYFLSGDYAVAVLTGNTLGAPRDRKVSRLYWVFFVFERIPLFTL